MKILVIDTLTETHNGTMVRSGLQKSAVLDAQGLSDFYDTTFMYCGNREEPKYEYRHLVVSPKGSKDICLEQGLNPKYNSSPIVKKWIKEYAPLINAEFDNIICHIHSLASFGLVQYMENKNVIFIVHDVTDYFFYKALGHAVERARKTNNNIKVMTNSQYSIDRGYLSYNRKRGDDHLLEPNELFDGYIKHFVWSDLKPVITEKHDFSSIIGRFDKSKQHHKLFKFKHSTHKIHHYGIQDPRRDSDGSYYERLKNSGNEIFENLPDKELWKHISKGMNVLIPCVHEGFGFTAFEAGIFGCVPIVFTNTSPNSAIGHATAQFLTRANAFHCDVSFQDNNQIQKTIIESRDVPLSVRMNLSKNLLDYFSLANYVFERTELLRSKK